jgi:hypothetical protein
MLRFVMIVDNGINARGAEKSGPGFLLSDLNTIKF